jgi:very-short-patch-repair endonuclease
LVALAPSTSDARHAFPSPGSYGRYIADFACHAKRIVIEVDGSQHAMQSAADEERTKALEANGYQVLRYWNNDVLTNIDGVLADILSKMNSDPHP